MKSKRPKPRRQAHVWRPDSVTRELVTRGVELGRRGQLPQAQAQFEELLRRQPGNPFALHHLGYTLRLRGRVDEGIALMRSAIKEKPDYTEAYRDLANALQELGRLKESIALLRRFTGACPRVADAHHELGLALYRAGRFADAAASMKRGLTLEPDNGVAQHNLGEVLVKLGDLDEALKAFERAVEINPEDIEARRSLADVLELQSDSEALLKQRQVIVSDTRATYKDLQRYIDVMHHKGRHEELLGVMRRLSSENPRSALHQAQLGRLLGIFGRFDEALAAYQRAVALDPGNPEFRAARLSLSSKVDATDAKADDLRVLEAAVADEHRDAEERSKLYFALGTAYEAENRFERAFTAIQAGNRLDRAGYRYDVAGHERLLEQIIAVFGEDLLDRLANSGHDDPAPLFVLGMPRSGTTLVEQILASHPDVHGAGELDTLGEPLHRLSGRLGAPFPAFVGKMQPEDVKRLGEAVTSTLRRYSATAKHITDKTPHNFVNIGLIRLALPNARIVLCERDPRDNCWSLYKNRFAGFHPYASDLEELGRYYRMYQRMMAFWDKRFPEFGLRVRYEDVVADQESQTRHLLDYCGLPWNDACMAFYETKRGVATASQTQVRRPIYDSSVQKWRNYAQHLGPLLRALGYESHAGD